ncbi:hypothetical protein BN1013_01394 [Candidatus Rubidus massiliensis]|nr:MAG: hypothetical protein BGO10_04360 [Chlamydia sp. 32-24]CDZ80871.1 hypothetical protein BN1013_01394 [Candidatus Rubidus massiliensis]
MANANVGLDIKSLITVVNDQTTRVRERLEQIQSNRDTISIADMFEMQMEMQNLSQLSEMSTSSVTASHQAISSMARNVKG